MTILDRMLFLSFLRAYGIVLVSTLSLYIIVDLFTNLDDFIVPGRAWTDILQHVFTYYGYRTIQYYDRLCEALALLAAMFTIAWMQRNNELLPMLSAGVSTHRVLRPIMIGSLLVLTIGMLNQEFVMPRIGSVLVSDRDDPEGSRELQVQGCFDPNGIHIEGKKAYRKGNLVKDFTCTMPATAKSRVAHLNALNAAYIPPEPNSVTGKDLNGGWLLTGVTPAELPPENMDPELVRMIDPGKYFVWVREATFEAATQGQKTLGFASTARIFDLLQRTDVGRMTGLAVNFHMRLSRAVVGMLLVVMGISITLRDQTRHVFISAGMCLGMCALFFTAIFACKFMGTGDYISPALAAWLPVLIFGPITVALHDAIHT
jgi:lipopolysaccharide export system permease protein